MKPINVKLRDFLFVILIISLNTKCLKAQQDTSLQIAKIDSIVNSESSNLEKVQLLNDFSEELTRKNIDLIAVYAILKNSQLLSDNDNFKALDYAEKANEIIVNNNFEQERYAVETNLILGKTYLRLGQNNLALEYVKKAIETIEKNSYDGLKKRSYSLIGNIYMQNFQLPEALESNNKLADFLLAKQDTLGSLDAVLNRSVLYARMRDFKKAKTVLDSVEQGYIAMREFKMLPKLYNVKGIVLKNMGDLNAATNAYNKGVFYGKKYNDILTVAIINANISVVNSMNGQTDSAKIYLRKALKVYNKMGAKNKAILAYINLARFHYADPFKTELDDHPDFNLDTAIFYLKKAFVLNGNGKNFNHEQWEIAEGLKHLYLYSKDIDSAAKYFEIYSETQDSIFAQESFVESNQAEIRYKLRGKIIKDSIENSLAQELLNNEIALEQSKLKQQKTLTYASLGGIALLLLLASSFYNSRQKTRKQNQAIEKRNTQIEWLLKEIHHRVKNNLQIVSSLMSIQGRSLNDEKSKALIRESQNRIKSMSLVHESLYQAEDLSQIEIEPFIKRIAESVKSSLKSKDQSIDLQIEADNFELNAEQAVPVGIIVNELASNAFKHAFNGRSNGTLKIAFKKENDSLTLLIDDDGPALPSDFEVDFSGGSIGMALVQSLAEEQLGGNFTFAQKENKFRIKFPLKNVA